MTKAESRPVFHRLPVRAYQDNVLVDALTDFFDGKLVSVGQSIEQLHTKLDPATSDEKYLDWLAYLVGMVPPYYNAHWPVGAKRKAIALADEIFKLRGTRAGLILALSIHELVYELQWSTDLKFDLVLSPNLKFGDLTQAVYIKMALRYQRKGFEFAEAQSAALNYTAICTPVLVCYDTFYLDFSVLGDPLF